MPPLMPSLKLFLMVFIICLFSWVESDAGSRQTDHISYSTARLSKRLPAGPAACLGARYFISMPYVFVRFSCGRITQESDLTIHAGSAKPGQAAQCMFGSLPKRTLPMC